MPGIISWHYLLRLQSYIYQSKSGAYPNLRPKQQLLKYQIAVYVTPILKDPLTLKLKYCEQVMDWMRHLNVEKYSFSQTLCLLCCSSFSLQESHNVEFYWNHYRGVDSTFNSTTNYTLQNDHTADSARNWNSFNTSWTFHPCYWWFIVGLLYLITLGLAKLS